MRPFCK